MYHLISSGMVVIYKKNAAELCVLLQFKLLLKPRIQAICSVVTRDESGWKTSCLCMSFLTLACLLIYLFDCLKNASCGEKKTLLFKSFGLVKLFSPRLYLFDPKIQIKNSNTIEYYYNLT